MDITVRNIITGSPLAGISIATNLGSATTDSNGYAYVAGLPISVSVAGNVLEIYNGFGAEDIEACIEDPEDEATTAPKIWTFVAFVASNSPPGMPPPIGDPPAPGGKVLPVPRPQPQIGFMFLGLQLFGQDKQGIKDDMREKWGPSGGRRSGRPELLGD